PPRSVFSQQGRSSAPGGGARVCLCLREAAFGTLEHGEYRRASAAAVPIDGTRGGSGPATVAGGRAVGRHGSGAIGRVAGRRGGRSRVAARDPHPGTEAR